MLIDTSYFVAGELSVPNIGKDFVDERLQYFIDTMVPQLLVDLFGYALAKPLMAELQAQEDASGSPSSLSTRFDKLVNGTEYIGQDGHLRKWKGLVFVEGTPRSLAAHHVFWYWLRDQQTQVSALGVKVSKAENAVVASSLPTLATISYQRARMINELYYFMLCSYQTDYPEWTSTARLSMLAFFKPGNQFGI